MVFESAVASSTTTSVICLRILLSALCPAAQAMIIPVLACFSFANPLVQSSVGAPSVIIKTKGFQSPRVSGVVFCTS